MNKFQQFIACMAVAGASMGVAMYFGEVAPAWLVGWLGGNLYHAIFEDRASDSLGCD